LNAISASSINIRPYSKYGTLHLFLVSKIEPERIETMTRITYKLLFIRDPKSDFSDSGAT
jgi:hypothetical protein